MENKTIIVYKIEIYFDDTYLSLENDCKNFKEAKKKAKKIMKRKLFIHDSEENGLIINRKNINYIEIKRKELIQF